MGKWGTNYGICSVDGCMTKASARGLCQAHYRRLRLYGSSTARLDPVEGFWSRVAVGSTDECWEWQRGTNSNGYGVVTVDYLKWTASRYAWTLTHGPIPPEKFICHTCDNRLCVNPGHLYVGNHTQNMADMRERGRAFRGGGRIKLTYEDVLEIRRLRGDGLKLREIQVQFPVSLAHISDIARGTRRTIVA